MNVALASIGVAFLAVGLAGGMRGAFDEVDGPSDVAIETARKNAWVCKFTAGCDADAAWAEVERIEQDREYAEEVRRHDAGIGVMFLLGGVGGAWLVYAVWLRLSDETSRRAGRECGSDAEEELGGA